MHREKSLADAVPSKDTFFRFIIKFMFPFAIPVLPLLYLMSFKETLNLDLEKDSFLLIVIVIGAILFVESRNLYVSDTDVVGSRNEFLFFIIPKRFRPYVMKVMLKLVLALITAFFIATPIVYCLLAVNQLLDKSQPTEIIAEVSTKKESRHIFFGLSQVVRLTADFPKSKTATVKVSEGLYMDINTGAKLQVVFRRGAFGYPYIVEVRPYKNNANPQSNNGSKS